jgi:hypothetical protein
VEIVSASLLAESIFFSQIRLSHCFYKDQVFGHLVDDADRDDLQGKRCSKSLSWAQA